MSRQESRALRQAQEAIEQRGDWTHPAPINFAEPIVAIIIMAAVALCYAAVTGRLDVIGAKLFAIIGV